MGNTGDFAIYSFPKMFPIQVGGLLVAKNKFSKSWDENIDPAKLRYIKNVLSQYISQKDAIIAKRIENYDYLKNKLNKTYFEERFPLSAGMVPGVFIFRIKNNKIVLPDLKVHLHAQGIQCSIFYGEHSFFIPVHQNLVKSDLDYFVEAISSHHK
jgi:hypothetical protein